MNIPNILTTSRFFLIPIYIWAFFSPSIDRNLLVSTAIFILAGITDLLDGYIARKYNMITKWGSALDPLADKMMQITVLICMTIGGYIPIWLPIVIIVKEGLMIIGGLILYLKTEKTVVSANRYGKLATVVFYIAVLIISLEINLYLNYIAIAITLLFMGLAFSNYYRGFREVHKEIK